MGLTGVDGIDGTYRLAVPSAILTPIRPHADTPTRRHASLTSRPSWRRWPMVHQIDARHLNTPNVIWVAVLQAEDGTLIMIDCGPETVFENGVRQLDQRGLGGKNVRHPLATHFDLDHKRGGWPRQR